ncbi:MAG: 2OG-Fe(II) oxygenase [Rhizomicrobium sp.]|jgi:hypothetical protein
MRSADVSALNLSDLERGVAARDAAAMTELGKRAIAGRAAGRSTHDGASLLAAAADAGDGEADALIAVMIGVDAATSGNWTLALGYLERAAFRGWQPARDQFALLASDQSLVALASSPAAPRDIWRRLKDTIDMGALTRPPGARVVFETPHVAVLENFASRAECEWMIGRARPRMTRASRQGSYSGTQQPVDAHTNSVTSFDILAADVVLAVLHARIAAAAGFSTRCLEETTVLHYTRGQKFGPHYDYFDSTSPTFRDELARGGQRAATFLVYLNDEFEGGETALLELKWQYKGRAGDALFFRSSDSSGVPDPRTLHAGLAPTSGEKWLLTQLIRQHPPRKPGLT